MSTLEVSNLNDGTTTVATTFINNGSAKATCACYHDSGTPTITDSTNVSSLTDDSTGTVFVNYSSNMASAQYTTASSGWAYSTWAGGSVTATGAYAVDKVYLSHRENGSLQDAASAPLSPLSCIVMGDLA